MLAFVLFVCLMMPPVLHQELSKAPPVDLLFEAEVGRDSSGLNVYINEPI